MLYQVAEGGFELVALRATTKEVQPCQQLLHSKKGRYTDRHTLLV